MKNNTKIEIRNLNCFYQDRFAIHNLNLSFQKNAITAIIGPANSGITTLLRSLNRLNELNPKARLTGEILLDGKEIHDSDVDVNDLRRKIGMVFDVPTSLPLSIYDNIVYGPRLKGEKNKKTLDELVEECLRRAALWEAVKDRLDSAAQSLSGGQQQRLCIARVLALKPEIILLDRPCSGLDPISTANIEESLAQLKAEFTIIIAPHSVQQASRISDYCGFMLMGELIEYGATTDLFTAPKDNRTNEYITGRFG